MKKYILTLGMCIIGLTAGYGQIISQYTETNSGTTPKGIEIWNNTESTLDFSVNTLDIKKGNNGDAPASDIAVTSGTLASGDVMVIGTSDMGTYLTNEGLTAVTYVSKAFTFNGDDALVVEYGGVVTDVFGDPGTGDPGAGWSGSGVQTYNQNIQLQDGIDTGDTDGFTDPSERFETVSETPVSDLTGFGVAPASGAAATKLNISLVNSGNSPTEDIGFEVVVQALDASDQLANVDSDIDITFTLGSGSGSLSGTTTGTISSGNSSVTISGTIYDTAESGVSITVTDDASGLSSATSSLFQVLDAASKLVIKDFPESGAANVTISSFTVEFQRSDDSVDENNTTSITISKVSGSGSIGGTLTKSAIDGVATFDDITFDADDDYTIQATDGSLTSAASSTITLDTPDFVETFETENYNVTGSYGDGSFEGTSSVTWTYVASRNDGGYPINGDNAIMLRRSSDNSSLTSDVISGGITDFSVKIRKAFTGSGDRQVELLIGSDANNLVSLGTSEAFDVNDEIRTFTVDNINYVGDFVLRISNPNSGQVNIDDISWNSYSDGEVQITGNAGWRMLSLPITGGTVEDVSDDTPVQGVTGGSDSGEEANFYINAASDGSASNGFTVPTNVSTAWGDGLGFILYFYNNTTNGSSLLPVSLDADGTEPSSDVSVSLSNTYTLVGNPFSSNIELDQLKGNDTGEGVNDGLISPISVWNDATSSYDTFNFGEENEISAWQGFFIERNSESTTSFSIPTSAKTNNTADVAIFSKQIAEQFRSIDLRLSNNEYNDHSTKLYFSRISNELQDGYDGSKLSPLNGSPSIAFLQDFGEGEVLLVQDARSFDLESTQDYQIVLNDAGISGEYTLSWEAMKNIPNDWEIILTDLETDESTNMRNENSYTFDVIAKQKRLNRTVLELPALKQKASNNSNPRFGITITPSTTVGIDDEISKVDEFRLEQNYPNPFNPSTTIKYAVAANGPVNITIYNITGQKVAELLNTTKNAGAYQVTWNATAQASGIYYYRLTAPGQVLTRQMTLIK